MEAHGRIQGGGAVAKARKKRKRPKSRSAILAQKRAAKAALEQQQTAIEPVNRDSRRKLAEIRRELKKLEKELSAVEQKRG